MTLRICAAVFFLLASTACMKQKLSEARTKAATVQLKMLGEALELYKLTKGTYPQALDALVEDDMLQKPQMDPWERAFVYKATTDGTKYDMFCLGPDGKPGTKDDVKIPRE